MTKASLSQIVRAGLILASLQLSLNLMAQTCSNATLNGTYTFVPQGNLVGANGALTPIEMTGLEVFDGNGNTHGVSTTVTVVNGQTTVSSNVPFTGTYTVSANCTVKETDRDANNNVFHYDVYVGPNGNHATFCQTDPGVILCGSENRDSGQQDQQ